jgi:hypothetical protein
MASAEIADTFEKFVNVEHEPLVLLQDNSGSRRPA